MEFLQHFLELLFLALDDVIHVLIPREDALFDIGDVLPEGRRFHLSHICVLFYELRREGLEKPQNVAADDQLAVAGGPAPME